ncbi:hypothetical protein Tco_1512142 [Tanacetum coccineum]
MFIQITFHHQKTILFKKRLNLLLISGINGTHTAGMWDIEEKLAERREHMAIRAYEEDKRRQEWYQKIEEDKRREEWYQNIKDDKRREAWNQKIEEIINLIDSFIQNPISSVKTPQPVITKVPTVTTIVSAKPIQNSPCYDDLTSDQNKKITEK